MNRIQINPDEECLKCLPPIPNTEDDAVLPCPLHAVAGDLTVTIRAMLKVINEAKTFRTLTSLELRIQATLKLALLRAEAPDHRRRPFAPSGEGCPGCGQHDLSQLHRINTFGDRILCRTCDTVFSKPKGGPRVDPKPEPLERK